MIRSIIKLHKNYLLYNSSISIRIGNKKRMSIKGYFYSENKNIEHLGYKLVYIQINAKGYIQFI